MKDLVLKTINATATSVIISTLTFVFNNPAARGLHETRSWAPPQRGSDGGVDFDPAVSPVQPSTEVFLPGDGDVAALGVHHGAFKVHLVQADSVAKGAVGVPEDDPSVAKQRKRDGGDVLLEGSTLTELTVSCLLVSGHVIASEIDVVLLLLFFFFCN